MSIESLLIRLAAQGPGAAPLGGATSATPATSVTAIPLQRTDATQEPTSANTANLTTSRSLDPLTGDGRSVHSALQPLTQDQVRSVLNWLFHIGESEPKAIAHVLRSCATSVTARQHILAIVAQTIPAVVERPDDRRRCSECANLVHRICTAASRREINAAPNYQPILNLLQRCRAFEERAHCR